MKYVCFIYKKYRNIFFQRMPKLFSTNQWTPHFKNETLGPQRQSRTTIFHQYLPSLCSSHGLHAVMLLPLSCPVRNLVRHAKGQHYMAGIFTCVCFSVCVFFKRHATRQKKKKNVLPPHTQNFASGRSWGGQHPYGGAKSGLGEPRRRLRVRAQGRGSPIVRFVEAPGEREGRQ